MEESFQKAISAWTQVGLANFQKVLDEQGNQVVENQTDGSASRKELATRTKEFKKLEDGDKLDQIKGLLKLYQGEIDKLTNRCKYAESCFLNSYKTIGDLADPLPLLEAASTAAHKIKELGPLKEKILNLEHKAADRADYDQIKQRLSDVETSSAKRLESAVEAKEREVDAAWDERARSWESREKDLTTELTEVKQNLEMAQARASSQGTADVSESEMKVARYNTLARELEKSTLKVAQVESRNQELRKELEEAKTGNAHEDRARQLEGTIQDLEADNVRLRSRFDSNKAKLEDVISEHTTEASRLSSKLNTIEAELQNAQVQLAKQQDYAQIKSELQFLRSVEFGDQSDSEEAGGDESSSAGRAPVSHLEQILQAKNNKLNEELAGLRVKVKTVTSENSDLEKQIEKLGIDLQKSHTLVEQLESDISTVQSHENDTFSTISGWTAVPRRVSPASSIVASRTVGPAPVRGPPSGLGQPGPVQAGVDPSILKIITQQRDRLKERTLELEEDLRRTTALITSQRNELEAVKQQNADLFERVRGSLGAKAGKSDRMQSVYEEGTNTYQQFKNLEVERLMVGKNAVDRAIVDVLSRAVTQDRFRYGVCAYAGALHIFLLMAIF